MSKRKEAKRLGHYSFIAGLIVAVLLGLFASIIPDLTQLVVIISLLILGVIVGLLNIKTEETIGFLVASLVLLFSFASTYYYFKTIPQIGAVLGAIWDNLIFFIGVSAIIVALKTVYALAEE